MRVNLIGILLFPTPTRHNRPGVYLRSLSPVEGFRDTLDLKAWVGLPETAVLLCSSHLSPFLCFADLCWPHPHCLPSAPSSSSPAVYPQLPPSWQLPISSKRHGQRLQLNPRSLGNSTAAHPHMLSPGSPPRKCTAMDQMNASVASHWYVFKFPPAVILS